MLNKNANCYNIEKNFKYSTVISTFSEHITIFRTLSIDILQLKCQQWQKKNWNKKWRTFFLQTFQNYQIFLPYPSERSHFWSKVAPTNCNRLEFLLHTGKTFSNVELYSIFSETFLELICATKIKAMLLKQSTVLFTSCQIKYCVYYVSEHLEYCSQTNEYWLNKNDCLNIVLDYS